MREIKFRAWEKYHKEMVYFDNAKAAKDIYIAAEMLNLMTGAYGDVLMQYTGIMDKNGSDIYEKDVIDWIFQDGNISAIVEWDDHRAHFFFKPLDNKFGNHHEFHKLTKMEIIGNIHENPELVAV